MKELSTIRHFYAVMKYSFELSDIAPDSYKSGEDMSKIEEFGANFISDEQVERFPNPTNRLLKRRVFFAERGLDDYISCMRSDRRHSIVTGIGPSGPMHIGHIVPLYFAKYVQSQTGANVYIPLSDDEKYLTRDKSLQTIQDYTIQNLKEILAVGFEPSKTRIIIDTTDSDVIYPVAVSIAKEITNSQVDAVYGSQENIGETFYPAVQAAHLILPQLVYGEHESTVLAGIDQDPHIRLARDVAGKSKYNSIKPGCMLSRYAPALKTPDEKMSSSSDEPCIMLTDTKSEIEDKIMQNAYSGGKKLKKEHREKGGNPSEDVPYNLLYYFFEKNDEELREIYKSYTSGEMLTGEIKQIAAEKISEFIQSHQARKNSIGNLEEAVEPYQLTKTERNSALTRVGYSTELDIN